MTKTPLTRFWVTRNRRIDSPDENQITARMMTPCCHRSASGLTRLKGGSVSRNWSSVTTRSAVATMTSAPGHQAQKPAKNPQKLPSALLVQT